jgi:putative lipoprotein
LKLKTTKSPRGALIRSLIIPGWGQFYNQKYIKSVLFLTVETYCISNYLKQYHKLQSAQSFADEEQYRDGKSLWAWRFIGAHLLDMTDAYVDAQLSGFDAGPELSLHLFPDLNEKRIIQFQYKGNIKNDLITMLFKPLTKLTYEDPWLRIDKTQHVIGSTIMSIFFIKTFQKQGNSTELSTYKGVSITLAVGITKEIFDSKDPNNKFSWKDLLADIIGTSLGVGIASIR